MAHYALGMINELRKIAREELAIYKKHGASSLEQYAEGLIDAYDFAAAGLESGRYTLQEMLQAETMNLNLSIVNGTPAEMMTYHDGRIDAVKLIDQSLNRYDGLMTAQMERNNERGVNL